MSQVTSLRDLVDQTAQMAKTKRLDISFNELMDMYEADPAELEITPDFQRAFVWNETQMSQFVESLLLELPLPPIYVIETGNEGHYLLIDGLQRLSSYLYFRGVLENPYRDIHRGDFLELTGCDIVKALNEKKWADLETSLQIRVKRAFISLQVVRRQSNPELKYHMFKRLNSGGTIISPQQVRNAYIRMLPLGDAIMNFARDLAGFEDFQNSCRCALTDDQLNKQDDHGFILRFFAFKNNRAQYRHDVDPFIDEYVEAIGRGIVENPNPFQPQGIQFDFVTERQVFEKTFSVLAASTGEYSCTYPNRSRTDLTSGFSAYHFEGVTLGLQSNLERLNPTDVEQMERLTGVLKSTRLSEAFRAVSSGGGKNSAGLLAKRIEIIEQAVARMF